MLLHLVEFGIRGFNMCNCKAVVPGTYENQIMLGWYPCMIEYRDNRVKSGLSGVGIPVDRCLADEIVTLWKNDIQTRGCCCGHNKYDSFINVRTEDFDKAIALGYEKYVFENDPERNDTIIPRSLSVIDPAKFEKPIIDAIVEADRQVSYWKTASKDVLKSHGITKQKAVELEHFYRGKSEGLKVSQEFN